MALSAGPLRLYKVDYIRQGGFEAGLFAEIQNNMDSVDAVPFLIENGRMRNVTYSATRGTTSHVAGIRSKI